MANGYLHQILVGESSSNFAWRRVSGYLMSLGLVGTKNHTLCPQFRAPAMKVTMLLMGKLTNVRLGHFKFRTVSHYQRVNSLSCESAKVCHSSVFLSWHDQSISKISPAAGLPSADPTRLNFFLFADEFPTQDNPTHLNHIKKNQRF